MVQDWLIVRVNHGRGVDATAGRRGIRGAAQTRSASEDIELHTPSSPYTHPSSPYNPSRWRVAGLAHTCYLTFREIILEIDRHV
jgi:hypothetical protein